MTSPLRRLTCLGCGYVAEALARRLLAAGWRVSGSARSAARARQLRAAGIQPFAPTPDEIQSSLSGGGHVLLSAAPTEEGDPFLAAVSAALAGGVARLAGISYLSSTSVYGDAGGDWVDESAPCLAGTERGRRRLAAEAGWRRLGDHAPVPVTVFRLAGIYGPGRSQLDAVRAGRARRIDAPGQVFSRIHVDDITAALESALTSDQREAVFNLADDEPAAAAEGVAYAAELPYRPPPPLVPVHHPSVSDRLRSMYSECRRVGNRRMKQALLPRLRHPTYREGLLHILSEA